jgi:hypothetical protein
MTKTCISCGMPMTKPADYPNADTSKDYCVHCARPDGSMQSYDEKRASMAAFMVRTQGLDQAQALRAAEAHLSKQPAWKAR